MEIKRKGRANYGIGEIKAINFNGNNVEHLYFNGTQIF